jgi:hypothetical protein
MPSVKELSTQIAQIKERNTRVEADKAWETSGARKILIVMLTYIVVVLFFLVAGLPHPFVNSLVPAIAFILSSLTIGLAKSLWLKRYSK